MGSIAKGKKRMGKKTLAIFQANNDGGVGRDHGSGHSECGHIRDICLRWS